MSALEPAPRSRLRSLAVPLLVVVFLAATTVWVWREQVGHQRHLLARHTEDVCHEAARRLQLYVEARLTAGTVFAHHWAAHGTRDLSRRRFDELGSLLVHALPGFQAVGLVPGPDGTLWVVPPGNASLATFLADDGGALVGARPESDGPALSAPVGSVEGDVAVFAAFPLRRSDERLGHLVVELRARALVDACFGARIRSEFSAWLEDDGRDLVRFGALPAEGGPSRSPLACTRPVPVGDRTWRLGVAPGRQQAGETGWLASAPIPILGFGLSLGLGLLVHLLQRRTRSARAAHHAAECELTRREEAERALRQALEQQALLSRKVIVAQEEERARLSSDLHDGLGQTLSALRLEVDWLRQQVRGTAPGTEGSFAQLGEILVRGAEELRSICRGLRPPSLDDLGLESSVRQLVEEFRERTSIATDLALDFDAAERDVSPDVALVSYRVLQEALTNVQRHAEARSAKILLLRDRDGLELCVVDDGRGFDPADIRHAGGLGIAGMRERARLVGGTFEVRSRPRRGTQVTLRVPLVGPDGEEAT